MSKERGGYLGPIVEGVAGAGGMLKAVQEVFEVTGPRPEAFRLDPIWWNGISRLASEVGIHPIIVLTAFGIASAGVMMHGMARGLDRAVQNETSSADSDIDTTSLNTSTQLMQSTIQNSINNSQNFPPQS